MLPIRIPLTTILALSLCATVTPAQEKASQGFVLEPGEYDIANILERASAFLSRNYFWDKASTSHPSARITIQKKLNLDYRGCEEVVSQLLFMKGFTVVPIDPKRGLYDVVSNRGQRVGNIGSNPVFMTPEEVLRNANLRVLAMTSLNLKHIDAARASQHLRPFLSASGGRQGLNFGSPGSQTSLLMQGHPAQLATAIKMLRDVDRPQPKRVTSVQTSIKNLVKLSNEQAQTIATLKTRLQTLEKRLADLEAKRTTPPKRKVR